MPGQQERDSWVDSGQFWQVFMDLAGRFSGLLPFTADQKLPARSFARWK
jgi:hypothetical protein